MPTEPIPFINKEAPGLLSLGGASPVAMNVFIDELGTLYRRPGIADSGLVPGGVSVDATGIIGISETLWGDVLACSDQQYEASIPVGRELYRLAEAGPERLTTDSLRLEGTGRPVFAHAEMISAIAGGAEILKCDLNNVVALLGGNPPQSTHVLAMTSRLAACDSYVDKTKVRYSDIAQGTTTYAGFETWTIGAGTAGFFTAEGRPDPVASVYESTNEMWAFGEETLQIFVPDASLVFAPLPTLELGCAAPYSPIKVDQQFAWLDHQRRFVLSGGRGFEVLSGPIQAELDALSTVEDIYGYRPILGPLDAFVWHSPSAQRSFVFQKGSGWGEWRGFGTAWQELSIRSHHKRVGSGENLVGLADGRIGKLSLSASTDLGDTIRAYIETGFLNRQTERLKKTDAIHLFLKRGGGGTALLSYRDRPGPWNPPMEVNLGSGTDTEVMVTFRSVGFPYRARQWRLEFSADADFGLVRATEIYTELEQ